MARQQETIQLNIVSSSTSEKEHFAKSHVYPKIAAGTACLNFAWVEGRMTQRNKNSDNIIVRFQKLTNKLVLLSYRLCFWIIPGPYNWGLRISPAKLCLSSVYPMSCPVCGHVYYSRWHWMQQRYTQFLKANLEPSIKRTRSDDGNRLQGLNCS